MLAGHPAGTGEEAQIGTEIAAGLPERCHVEIQPLHTGQRTKINIDGSAEPVPTRESTALLALDVPERVADVLQIESDATLEQTRPRPAPVAQEVPVRALAGLVAVWTAERFLLRRLGKSRRSKSRARAIRLNQKQGSRHPLTRLDSVHDQTCCAG